MNQVVEALCNKYGKLDKPLAVAMDHAQLSSDMQTPNERRFYYGIFTTGRDTDITLQLVSDSGGPMLMDIVANRQIIELVDEINAINGTNLFFRGYLLTVAKR
ncbi:hypothetical protein [Flagellimonas sp.]|uniref:hypothetical protein n=1 Tax=Flagellimonas sp. TaxID=2058762 RepID=UPI003BAB5286